MADCSKSEDLLTAGRRSRRRGKYALAPGPVGVSPTPAENERGLVALLVALAGREEAETCAGEACQEVANLLGADGVTIILATGAGEQIVAHWGCRIPTPPTRETPHSVVFLPDMDLRENQDGLASLLVLPVTDGQDCRGQVALGWRRIPIHLDAAELAFAARAAQVAIVCIAQARRFEKLRAERELLNSLTQDLIRLTDSFRAENSVLQQAHQKLCAEYQDLQEAARSLESLAERDGLTGLYNHRAFQNRLREEVSRAERSGQPLVLAVLDLDDFKGYNDAYGHLEGDKALATCGLLLKECVRRCDFVARYGGEELAVLFPLTELKTAHKVAERLRRKLAGHPFVCRQMTVSVGLASYQEEMSPQQLLAAADKALYEAKNAGRNQVRIARELKAA